MGLVGKARGGCDGKGGGWSAVVWCWTLGRGEEAGIELRVGNRPLPRAATRRGASRAAATVGTRATAPFVVTWTSVHLWSGKCCRWLQNRLILQTA